MVTLIDKTASAAPAGPTRRDTLRWVAAAMPLMAAGCGAEAITRTAASDVVAGWRQTPMPVRTGPGYGEDPNMMAPKVPWRLVMSEGQLRDAGAMADVILPADDPHPSATGADVHLFLDEWVSAPYPRFQADRQLIFDGLSWSNREARRRFGVPVARLSGDDVAAFYDPLNEASNAPNRAPEAMRQPGRFFATLKALVTGGYYTSAAGVEALGYVGNVALPSPWPGPTPEAMAHLERTLAGLGLSVPATRSA